MATQYSDNTPTLGELEQQREIVTRAFFNRECSKEEYNKHIHDIEDQVMVSTINICHYD